MNHRIDASFRSAGALAIIGGAVVLAGTYLIAWFSLSTYPPSFSSHRVYSYGGITLYHLQSFVAGNVGWYAFASVVMTLGGLLLVASGIVIVSATTSRRWLIRCASGMAVGSVTVLCAALGTGLPHWETMEPLIFTRGRAEWICVVGTVLGLTACVMAARSISRTGVVRQDDRKEKTPVARVG